ncbi:hypothetical protein [Bdellovibrio sp. HCB337]|uniref:hypothetical protein n=1 Tax=Bdellovibrio sp. HCB337 TaxID=3394358 RepID=UPI0039A69AA5
MKALLISILLLGTQAYANTAFDTLRDAFNNASTPATIQDFEYGHWKGCAFSDIGSPQLTRATQVRTLQYMTAPGQGPLFPGDNDYRIDVFYDYSIDQNIVSFFNSSRIEEDGVNFRQVLDGPPWRHMNIYGRTGQDMMFFYVEISNMYGPQAPMYPRVYGYCWNDPTNNGDPGDKPDDGTDDGEVPLPKPN